jgi:hypothetical protein
MAPELAITIHPAAAFRLLTGTAPDPWQEQVMNAQGDTLVLTSRQAGKSTVASAIALHTALATGGTVLIVAPTERQSTELALKVRTVAVRAGLSLEAEGRTYLELSGGGRVIALPGAPENVRGYSAALVIIDEAAYVPDELYVAVRPMLAVTRGRILAITTPAGTRGWFWREWVGSEGWEKARVTAYDISRYDPAFLEREKATLGELAFRQEYLAEFVGAGGAIDPEHIARAVRLPGPEEPQPGRRYVAGLDLARLQDWTALAVLDATDPEAMRLVKLERFRAEWEETVGRVAQVVRAYGARLMVDATGVGDPVYERLKRAWPQTHPYRFTANSKPPLIAELRLSLAEERLALYPEPVLLSELQTLEARQTAYGVSYSAPAGGHDDTVMALALAVWAARVGAVAAAPARVRGRW